ncbi:MAG TPA: hypothetical protein DEQ02_02110 [Ruminococcaceae bacterium]|nr:hypothetical protein [Oscillospiraceae bacterium]
MIVPHRKPIRRNRNIGTAKSGYKKQSDFDIPIQNHKPFYENIDIEEQCQREINGQVFRFIVEKLNRGYIHVCGVDEICKVLSYCPREDLNGLALIILRQPKKKEEIFRSCWGRFIQEFYYQAERRPAIILEAVNIDNDIKMKTAGISPFFQKEIEKLRLEGHEIKQNNGIITIKKSMQSVKQTQLYRTLLHEVGHYVFSKRNSENTGYEEKETFANNYREEYKKYDSQ